VTENMKKETKNNNKQRYINVIINEVFDKK